MTPCQPAGRPAKAASDSCPYSCIVFGKLCTKNSSNSHLFIVQKVKRVFNHNDNVSKLSKKQSLGLYIDLEDNNNKQQALVVVVKGYGARQLQRSLVPIQKWKTKNLDHQLNNKRQSLINSHIVKIKIILKTIQNSKNID